MATPRPDTYTAPPGTAVVRLGRNAPATPGAGAISGFDSVSSVDLGNAPSAQTIDGKILAISLHGSGTFNFTQGRLFTANVSGNLAHSDQTQFKFGFTTDVSQTTEGYSIWKIKPSDNYGTVASGSARQSMWMGFADIPGPDFKLITHRRLDAMIAWLEANLKHNPKKLCLDGGSMGGWGTLHYGLRKPNKFAALYPSRPRWRYDQSGVSVDVPYWAGWQVKTPGAAPNVAQDDGGGTYFERMDHITYVGNTANKVPWIGWSVGRKDGYMLFQDHIDAVAALRAAKRGFAFYWNDGNHGDMVVMNMSKILQSYKYGTFEIGKGYPLFTNHSLDIEPTLDAAVLEGGINIGLMFRNVVESSSSWSCEVTSVIGACAVTVEPICSDIFKAAVAPKTISIPAANSWVTVNFTA